MSIAVLCSYVPQELITALGLKPERLLGIEQSGLSDSMLSPSICPFVKALLNKLLSNDYEGIIMADSCDAMRRLYDIIKIRFNDKFLYLLSVPRKINEKSINYYAKSLWELKDELCRHFKKTITNEDINNSIRIHNNKRELLMRTSRHLRASDFLDLIFKTDQMDVNQAVNHLKSYKLNEEVKGRNLIITSTILTFQEQKILRLLDDEGFSIVLIDSCNAERSLNFKVEEGTNNPLQSLAKAYLNKPACSRMFKNKAESIVNNAVNNNVSGVVQLHPKFCDNSAYDTKILNEELKKSRIPFLNLEVDYGSSNLGQVRTRIQAFKEMIE